MAVGMSLEPSGAGCRARWPHWIAACGLVQRWAAEQRLLLCLPQWLNSDLWGKNSKERMSEDSGKMTQWMGV